MSLSERAFIHDFNVAVEQLADRYREHGGVTLTGHTDCREAARRHLEGHDADPGPVDGGKR